MRWTAMPGTLEASTAVSSISIKVFVPSKYHEPCSLQRNHKCIWICTTNKKYQKLGVYSICICNICNIYTSKCFFKLLSVLQTTLCCTTCWTITLFPWLVYNVVATIGTVMWESLLVTVPSYFHLQSKLPEQSELMRTCVSTEGRRFWLE